MDNSPASSKHSAGLLVALDVVAMTANLVKVFPRPNGQLSRLRGNMQVLPNSDVLINWSANGFMSEFTHDGQHVLDVQFASHRFTTYRGYKFNVTLKPIHKPVMKAFVFGLTHETAVVVFYASWNGATEVAA